MASYAQNYIARECRPEATQLDTMHNKEWHTCTFYHIMNPLDSSSNYMNTIIIVILVIKINIIFIMSNKDYYLY